MGGVESHEEGDLRNLISRFFGGDSGVEFSDKSYID
ncbi:unnamed protein product [Linum tenue]|uniref:Uncharacterized protein n=1 Tax=Linum tenue TaxID=586396 RepID=A0AAV0KPK5_9ROSI|nr:unnamed protein product [Linum tenue]